VLAHHPIVFLDARPLSASRDSRLLNAVLLVEYVLGCAARESQLHARSARFPAGHPDGQS
jgi:hypothetical protein